MRHEDKGKRRYSNRLTRPVPHSINTGSSSFKQLNEKYYSTITATKIDNQRLIAAINVFITLKMQK